MHQCQAEGRHEGVPCGGGIDRLDRKGRGVVGMAIDIQTNCAHGTQGDDYPQRTFAAEFFGGAQGVFC